MNECMDQRSAIAISDHTFLNESICKYLATIRRFVCWSASSVD